MKPRRASLFEVVEPSPVYTVRALGGALSLDHRDALRAPGWPDRMTLCAAQGLKVTFNNPRERHMFALGLGLALSADGARRPE